jgi:hypothetical protein
VVSALPSPYRDLAFQDRFRKYQIISLDVERPSTDQRPESYRPNVDSLELGEWLDSKKGWAKRRPLVEPLEISSMCELARRQQLDGTSLGAFRPAEVADFTIEEDERDWDPAKQAVLAQPSLLFPEKAGLVKIPYRFRYRYRCSDGKCGGHHQSVIDWELAEAFRRWPYPEQERLEKIRQRWLDEMYRSDKDTLLFVGNQHRYPEGFLVLGVFWPPKAAPAT